MASTSQKLGVLLHHAKYLKEALSPKSPKEVQELTEDLSLLISKFQECLEMRNHYAHAKYHPDGYPVSITIFPFFGDFKKRKNGGIDLTLEKVRVDFERITKLKLEIRDYIIGDVRPTK